LKEFAWQTSIHSYTAFVHKIAEKQKKAH